MHSYWSEAESLHFKSKTVHVVAVAVAVEVTVESRHVACVVPHSEPSQALLGPDEKGTDMANFESGIARRLTIYWENVTCPEASPQLG